MDLNSIIEEALRDARLGAMRELESLESSLGEGFDKVANLEESEETPQPEMEVDLEYVEKVASSLEFLIGQFEPTEDLRQRLGLGKEAASATCGVGGGHQMKTTKTNVSGKQSQNVGQAHHQMKKGPLQGTPGGQGKTAIPTEESAEKLDEANRAGMDHMDKKAAREALKARILAKTAGSNGEDANITQATLPGPSGVWAMGEGPGLKAPGAQLLHTNEAAVGFTKRDAKKLVLPDLSKALTEPAFSKKTDPVLHENLRNASKAGVKIAGLSTPQLIRNRLKGGK